MNIYLKSIRVIDPNSGLDERMNIKISNGKISHCSTTEATIDPNDKVIEGEKLVCAPGFFDMSVNFNEPGHEHNETIESGALAAANGGFTGVLNMPSTEPVIEDMTGVEYIRNKAKDLAVDVEISAALSQKQEGKLLSPLMEMADNGVRMFTDYPSCIQSPEMMRRAYDYASGRDSLIAQLPYDNSLTGNFVMNESKLSYKLGLKGFPGIAEEMIISRDIMIAAYTGNRRYHAMQVSSEKSMSLIAEAKSKNMRVSAAVTPYHIMLTEHELSNYDSNYKIKLPLREQSDVNALIKGIKQGVIDTIVSDHLPYAQHLKDVELEGSPFGISGLETIFGITSTVLVHENGLSLSDFIKIFSVNPRRILGLDPVKIKTGEKANMTIFDPEESWNVSLSKFKSKSTNNPFEGNVFKGKPKFVINNNQLVECSL